jgi:DNA-binding MarR family transcriptional regulator
VDKHDAAELAEATKSLRELILAAEYYRQLASNALDLGVSDSQAISYLYARGAMGQTSLGELLGYNTGTMTVLVDRLERSGMAERIPHPTDRRRLIVQLTKQGRGMLERTSRSLSYAFKSIPPDQIASVTEVLRSIAGDLRDHAGAETLKAARS